MTEDDEVIRRAKGWLAEGKGVALATVVGTWGSSPRPAGSMLAVADDKSFVGSVSGGCIEGTVITEGLRIIAGAPPRLLEFGVSDEQAWEVGLACGGQIRVYIEPAPGPETLRALTDDRPVAWTVELDSGRHALIGPESSGGELRLDATHLDQARHALDHSRSGLAEDGRLFFHVFAPPLRMVVVGAVHIAQVLAPMAALAGFQVTVVDPRRAFATAARFPEVTLSHAWPDEALRDFRPDSRTAVVTLTHDPKLDDPALLAALASKAYYVGALGSRRTHDKRLKRLAVHGLGEAHFRRIHAPIGLRLGGRRASEIAVAILAEAVAACYGKDRPEAGR